MKITKIAAPIAVFAASLLLAGAQNLKEGKKSFDELCAGCHGPDGKAQTDMGKQLGAADLTSSDVQQMSDSAILKQIKNGKGKMPAFGDKVSGDEARAIAAYVKTLGKKQ